MKQVTCMMLKPDAFANHQEDEVVAMLTAHGLCIEKSCRLEVTMEVMKVLLDHYHGVIDAMDKEFNFPGKLFASFYYNGPRYIQPMRVSYEGEEDIITLTRQLVGKTNPAEAGPETIRGRFSEDNYEKASREKRLVNNVIHASDAKESAERELQIWQNYL